MGAPWYLLVLLALVIAGLVLAARRSSRPSASTPSVPPVRPPPLPTPPVVTPPVVTPPVVTPPVTPPVVTPPVTPGEPSVRVFPTPANVGPVVPLLFLLKHPDNEPTDVAILYDAGTGLLPATPAEGSVSLSRLPAPSVTTDYRFLWNAAADLGPGQRRSVTVEVRAGAGSGAASRQRLTVEVDTTPAPAPPTNRTTPVVVRALEAASGDGQGAIAGQLLHAPLRVRVRDAAGRPVPGARVAFAVVPGPTADGDLEEDPERPTTTGADGIASIRLRPRRGARGAIGVVARVAGAPGLATTFTATVRRGSIVPDPGNDPPPLEHGRWYRLEYRLLGDPALPVSHFDVSPGRPIRWRVQVTNAVSSTREWVFETGWPVATVDLTPTTLDQPVVVTLTDVDDPSITYSDTLAVRTPVAPYSRRLTSYPNPIMREPAHFLLTLEEGAGPGGAPQVGYPGLTLKQPFRVTLRDASGAQYTRRVTSGGSGCGTVGSVPLEVRWVAQSGFLSATEGPGTVRALTAPMADAVWFTPAGRGPWNLKAVVRESVVDRDVRGPFHYFDPLTNQPACYQEQAIEVFVEREIVVSTAAFDVHDAVTGAPLTDPIAPGASVYVVATGLSEYLAGGVAEDARLQALLGDGRNIGLYTGDLYPFEQPLPMRATSPTGLVSERVLVVQGYPRVPGQPPLIQGVLPRSWLRFDTNTRWPLHRPTAGKRWERRVIDGVPSPQEAVAGTSPYDGFDGSIQLCSGEMVRSVTDLSFATRGGTMLFARTYRDHLDGEGMFGPGWIGMLEASLDLSRSWGARMLDGYGRLFDLVERRIPEGLYLEFHTHWTLDADHGAAEVKDRFGTSAHYHLDGSLKLIRDRNGNRTTFAYDERSRLVEVTDPLGRVTTLTYYPESTTPKELRGRLWKLVDFDGREVEYDYYRAAGADGRPGWLMRCSRPPAPTLLAGTLVDDFRRSELYRYHVPPDPGADGSLREILSCDDQGRREELLVQVHYSGDRRVVKQLYGGGELSVEYLPGPPRQARVTDRARRQRLWTFKESPHPDGSTPTQVLEKNNRSAGGADAVTTLEHNRHGEVTALTHPGGGRQLFVYDDGSAKARSRGNLLSSHELYASGSGRLMSWTYEEDFNQVKDFVDHDGHRLGLQRYLRTDYQYDARGNLTRVILPRTLGGVLTVNGGRDEVSWLADQPAYVFTYNAHGLVATLRDPQGVETHLAYYPEGTPQGGAGVATSPDGGGFLGGVVRDARANTLRDTHYPNQPVRALRTALTHDRRGDIATVTDEHGVTTRYRCSALRQVTSIEHHPATAGGVTVTEHFRYDRNGLLVRRETEQGSAAPLGPTDIVRDADGRVVGVRAGWERGASPKDLVQEVSRDGEGMIEAVFAPTEATPGAPASSGPEWLRITRDQRGLPFQQLLSPAAGPFSYDFGFGADGEPLRVAHPGGAAITATPDPTGESYHATDTTGTEVVALADESGEWTRVGVRRGAQAGGFHEIVVNELNHPHRYHRSLTGEGGGSFPIRDSFEGYLPPPASEPWPLAASGGLEDLGKWGPGDGRASTEVLRDFLGDTVRVVDDECRALFFARRPLGGTARVFDGRSFTVRYLPDARGEPEIIEREEHSTDPTRPAGRTLRWKVRRDGQGRCVAVSDGLGNVTRAAYNLFGEIERVTDAMGPDSPDPQDELDGHRFNTTGNTLSVLRDERGHLRRLLVDMTANGAGAPLPVPEPNPFNPHAVLARSFDYDAAGRLVTVTDSAGNRTDWRYSNRPGGRCLALTHQGQPPTRYEYDVNGRLNGWRDPNDTIVRLHFNPQWLVEKVEVEQSGAGLSGATGYTFTYDGLNRLGSATEVGSGRVTRFGWSFGGDLLSEEQHGLAVRSTFDGTGQRRVLEYPSGPVVDYHYDSSGRLRRIERRAATPGDAPTVLARYEYIGRRTILNRATGPVKLQLDYDAAGRLTREWLEAGQMEFVAEPRRDGRHRKWTRKAGTVTETREWHYDSAGRIVHENAAFAPGRTPDRLDLHRFLDGDGVVRLERREESTAGVTTTTANRHERGERGRITQRNGATVHYEPTGNLSAYAEHGYFYDFLYRLVQVKDTATGVDTFFEYDALGRCSARHRGGSTERYLYDGWRLIEVRVREGGVDRLKERYFYGRGMNEVILAEIDGAVRYLVPAPDGSVDSLLDEHGAIIESYDYSLQGRPTVLDAARRPLSTPPRCRFGFHGHVYDPATELLCVRHRYYHTGLGQFLTPDPVDLVRTTNLYAYAQNDPVNRTDYFGYDDDYIDWRAAALPAFATLGTAFVIGAGLGVVAGLFPATIPLLLPLFVALLVGAVAYHAVGRLQAGQTFLQSLGGGALDTIGVSSICHGLNRRDPATGLYLPLTPGERGEAMGSGLGMLAGFVAAGFAFGAGRAAAGALRQGTMVLRAGGVPREEVTVRTREWEFALERADHLVTERIELPGRPRTFEEFVDAIQMRLQTMPGPGARAPHRESAILRLNTYDAAGQPRGGDFVMQTRLGAGTEHEVDGGVLIAAAERLFWWNGRLSRPRHRGLRLRSYAHDHPPGTPGEPAGHSEGDLAFAALTFLEGRSSSRLGPDFTSYLIRISADGSPGDAAFLTLGPPTPRAPASTVYPPPPPLRPPPGSRR